MSRAVIYTRISLDPEHDSYSPDRQEELCRQRAEQLGHEVVAVHTDRNASAWNRRSKRPGWKALRESVERGEVDVVMAYSLTRLGRRVRDLADLTDFLEAHSCALVVYDTNIDTTTPMGRMFFTFMSALAEWESEQISQRVKSATGLSAQRGRMHTGGQRQFGYGVAPRDDSPEEKKRAAGLRETVNEEEAGVLRDVVSQVLGGESLRQCAFRLNDEGVRTTSGKTWTGGTLGQTLRSPRIAGLRTHQPNPKLPPTIHRGDWEPIVSEETWLELQALLKSRRRGTGINTKRHLLSGLLKCGRCGNSMGANFGKNGQGEAMPRYVCNKQPGDKGGCGRMAVARDSTERFVTERFFDFMSEAEMLVAEDSSGSLAEVEEELAEVQGQMTALARKQYMTPDQKLPESVFDTLVAEMATRSDELKRVRATLSEKVQEQKNVLRPGSREDIVAWWGRASLPERREALSKAIRRVEVHPARVRGSNKFQTDRIRVVWSTKVYFLAGKKQWESMTPEEQEAAGAFVEDEAGNRYVLEIEPPT